MGQRLIDISGDQYGFLKVISFSHMGGRRRSYWKCKCLRCGKEVVLRKDNFAYPYSKVKSCGCWHIEESSKRPKDKKSGKFIKIK